MIEAVAEPKLSEPEPEELRTTSKSRFPLSRCAYKVARTGVRLANSLERVEFMAYLFGKAWPEFWGFVMDCKRQRGMTRQAQINFGLALKRKAERTNDSLMGDLADHILDGDSA